MKKRIVLLIISLIVSLSVSEVFLRVFAKNSVPMYVSDKKLGNTFRKNLQIIHRDLESDMRPVPVSINSFGFRDEEWEFDDDSFKIMVVGDSFVGATQVAAEERFTELLEKKFLENNLNVSVYNLGIAGRGPDGYLLFLREFYQKINPDVVIVALYNGNDFNEVNYKLTPANRRINYIVKGGKVFRYNETTSKRDKFIRRNIKVRIGSLYLAQFAHRAYLTFKYGGNRQTIGKIGNPYEEYTLYCRIGNTDTGESFAIVEWILREMKSIAGDSMIVVQIPAKEQLDIDKDDSCDNMLPEKFIADVTSRNNIKLLQLLPLMGENMKNYYWWHFNYEGHVFVADALYDYIRPTVESHSMVGGE